MRSFNSLALRQVRARPLRALLTGAGIVLGVAMVFGVLVLSATIRGTFSDLFDSIYGRTDLVVSGEQGTGSLPASSLRRVRRVRGVAEVSANITNVWTLVDRGGRAKRSASGQLNVAGIDPRAPDLTDADQVAGHRPRHGREIDLQRSWAETNEIRVGDRIRLATPSGVARLRVSGLFQFSTGLDFGGQGFGTLPISVARRLMDKPRVYDEIDVVVAGRGAGATRKVRKRIERVLGRGGKGVQVTTPSSRSADVDRQLQSFDVILLFFAGMALFVGGFLIFNAFNMTVLQRMREIGMLRTLGAKRSMISRTVLQEALLLGLVGIALGLGVGIFLAKGLVALLKALNFPVGGLVVPLAAAVVAVATGVLTTLLGALNPARRAARVAPIQAVLGGAEVREHPTLRRAALGVALVGLGGAGAYWLAAAAHPHTPQVAAGLVGIVGVFLGLSLIVPFLVVPLVRALSWPARRASSVTGRLAADAASSNPKRTGATATALTVGLALVVAFGTIGSSFLGSISSELDRDFARDLTVQPRGFAPGQGPQQSIAKGLRARLARIPEAAVVARERIHFLAELPRPHGATKTQGLIFGFDPGPYSQVDQTELKGASRKAAYRRVARGQVTVGETYAKDAGLKVGDRLVLRGGSGSQRTRVAALVKTVVFGGNTIGMSVQTMRRVYGVTADSQLALKARSKADRPLLDRKVHRIVEHDYPQLVALSNDEFKSKIEDQINQQFGFFNAILGVAVIVSLFGIVNTLTMSVIERRREIGVLRAVGATRWQVRRTIVNESLLIALIGALIGVVVGAGLGWVVFHGVAGAVPGAAYTPPVGTIISVAIAAVILGLLAAVLPARRAARLDVIEALSYE
ncbi:MAG: putative transport system permease protein [Solirubrobacterales bacterium]|jgi:putative ABC transport system permease protein|nr:putative transport system permease protein [Solirubrobacterales bacterium]